MIRNKITDSTFSFVLILFLTLSAWGQGKLTKLKVNDHITLSVPATMFPMTPEDIIQRFPSVRQPMVAYTDMNRMVDYSVTQSATMWLDSDIELAQKFFRSSIINLYDRVEMVSEGLREVNGRTYIYFEFESLIRGESFTFDQKGPVRKYTHIQYLLINGKTLVFSFSCPLSQKEEWQDIAHEMLQGVRVKNTI
jgi:hypothetical protein